MAPLEYLKGSIGNPIIFFNYYFLIFCQEGSGRYLIYIFFLAPSGGGDFIRSDHFTLIGETLSCKLISL